VIKRITQRVAAVLIVANGVASGVVAAQSASAAYITDGAAGSAQASSGVRYNAPGTTTTTTVTTLSVPAARCAQLKARYPAQASNPRLCRPVHIEKQTLTTVSGSTRLPPRSCWLPHHLAT